MQIWKCYKQIIQAFYENIIESMYFNHAAFQKLLS